MENRGLSMNQSRGLVLHSYVSFVFYVILLPLGHTVVSGSSVSAVVCLAVLSDATLASLSHWNLLLSVFFLIPVFRRM